MNSSFKVSSPTQFLDHGVPDSLSKPFPEDHKLKLFFQPFLTGLPSKESSSPSGGTLKAERLCVEPYALSLTATRRGGAHLAAWESSNPSLDARKEEGEESCRALKRGHEEKVNPEEKEEGLKRKKPRVIRYRHRPSELKDEEEEPEETSSSSPRNASAKDKRKKEEHWIKLSNGQVLRVPSAMWSNIQLLKSRAQSLSSQASALPQATVALTPLPKATVSKVMDRNKKANSSPSGGLVTKKQPFIQRRCVPQTIISTSTTTTGTPIFLSASSKAITSSTPPVKKTLKLTQVVSGGGVTRPKVPSSQGLVMKSIMMEKPATAASPLLFNGQQLPPSHIIALKTQDKNGQIIYLKSVPNQKPLAAPSGTTRVFVSPPGASQRTPGSIQLPLKLVKSSSKSFVGVGPSSSSDGLLLASSSSSPASASSRTTPHHPILVKRIIPSDMHQIIAPQALTCPPRSGVTSSNSPSSSTSSPSTLNGKYRDIMKLSTTLKHVLSQSSFDVPSSRVLESPTHDESVFLPTERRRRMNDSSSQPILKDSDLKDDHDDYSSSSSPPRGSKLSEVLLDISKRGVFVETTAVSGNKTGGGTTTTMNIPVPQRDLLAFAARAVEGKNVKKDSMEEMVKEDKDECGGTSLKNKKEKEENLVMNDSKGRRTSSRRSKRASDCYVDEALPSGWFVMPSPKNSSSPSLVVTSDGARLSAGKELSNYLIHGMLPSSSQLYKNICLKQVSLKDMPIRRAVVCIESL